MFVSKVISIDLSPVGTLLATGSGDWQARICMFQPFQLRDIVLTKFDCLMLQGATVLNDAPSHFAPYDRDSYHAGYASAHVF